MRPRLALLFLFALATIYPVPSCRYKTYAQESASTDENAGIMTLASGDLAYTRISDLIRGEVGSSYYSLSSETSSTNAAELYTYILKDVADDSTGDVWLFSGSLLAYGRKTSSQSPVWFQLSLCGTLYKLTNGNWALKSSNVGFGLPGNMTSFSNTYGVTYDEGATFFEQYVAAARRYCELLGTTFNEATYANYINYATWDTDEGGVNNLAEWVRGTRIDYWQDDVPSDSKCKCGACCSCECKCGQWSGAECGKTSNDCACHPKEPDCTCADYCCACECKCEKCADGTHSAHQNGSDTCDGTIGDIIGFVGCDCHKTTEEKECECAKYCCKHTCKCEKCGDGEHSAHENGSATCDNTDGESGCACHKTDDPENPDEEECECAKYCCLHTCACKKCGDGEHSAHGNGLPTCDGTTENTGCACHETTGDEEECACANYCCYHTCACKRCASLPAEKHSQHKNGSPTCNGTTGSGGCACHETTGEENDKLELPADQDYEVPEEKQKETFLPDTELNDAFGKLKSKLAQKFGLEKLSRLLDGDLSGDLPSWSFPLPEALGGAVDVDFNDLLDYPVISLTRGVLSFLVYFFTATTVFNSLRRLL